MHVTRVCPDCGTEKIKALTSVTGSERAYLCENGHFFQQPILLKEFKPAKPSTILEAISSHARR